MTSPELGHAPSSLLKPRDECDLVMKGGLTSAIAYPPAVLELATRYRFRNIGGASAGAIAAALVAAAEYARANGGFERLRELNEYLADPGNVLRLFQPSGDTRPAFAALLALMEGPRPPILEPSGTSSSDSEPRGPSAAGRLVTWLHRGCRVATAYGRHDLLVTGGLTLLIGCGGFLVARLAALGAGARESAALLWGVGSALGLGILGYVIVASVRLLALLFRGVPRHSFGICTGLTQGRREAPALTEWLADEIDRIAGLEPGHRPLTIGDLADRGIRLQMVTTNLSLAQPHLLPFETRLLFSRREIGRLFPPRIVQHLWDKGEPAEFSSGTEPKDCCFLPPARDLPAVFCARLSLSFPVLISAVPLWTRGSKLSSHGGAPPQDRHGLQRNWFSDGGISSNFPLHFFDRWLPTRPGFGIDLTEMPDHAFRLRAGQRGTDAEPPTRGRVLSERYISAVDASDEPEPSQVEDVVLLRANQTMYPEWSEIDGLLDFLSAIWETSHSSHENMLMQLPGFRDRVVRVRFATGEGGLNLSMSHAAVASIRDKGERAGKKLAQEFSFDDHRWVRFRVLMAELERHLVQLASAYREARYDRLIACACARPYDRPEAWREEAERRMTELIDLVRAWEREGPGLEARGGDGVAFFAQEEPRPRPTLRIVPRV